MRVSATAKIRGVLCALALCAVTTSAGGEELPPERQQEPVIVPGASLGALAGTKAAEIRLYRYDAGSGWRPIAHQMDERRMSRLWPAATCPAQCEKRYVFSGEEGNGLDDDDELVFLAGDLGEKAASGWPEGAGDRGHEIEVAIPQQGARYAYVFAAPGLPAAAAPPAVSYSRKVLDPDREDTTVTTDRYRAHFSRLWVLDELAVLPGGGGNGTDLLDQWKGRAYDRSLRGETEDVVGMCGGWSNSAPQWGTHRYLGHITGPVRAIRGVQGACSWPNLTRYDLFYRDMAEIVLNVRGHAFSPGTNGLWMYWDYAKAALPLTYYSARVPGGTTLDGKDDPAYANGDHPVTDESGIWEQIASPHGGIAFTVRQTVPIPGPLKSFIGDDADYDDGTGSDPSPRRSVLGGHGVHIVHIGDTDPRTGGKAAQAVIRYRPLPAGAGSAGGGFLATDAAPLAVKTTRL